MNRRALLFAGTGAAAAAAWRSGLSIGNRGIQMPAKASVDEPALGINLSPINYWSPVAFIDRFKSSGKWSYYGKVAPVDALGLPTGVGGYPFVATMIPCEAGTFVLLHDGDIEPRLQGGTILSRARGRVVFEARDAFATGRQFIVYAIRKQPSFMHFIRKSDEAAFVAGEIFVPELVAQLRGFNTLRFMDWLRINFSEVTDAFRDVGSFSYADGVPLEIALALAKKVRARPWVCLPHLATDNFVIRTIKMLAAAGEPDSYLEYSNEVWNRAFSQALYADQQAKVRWDASMTGATFYGYRSGQIARAARGSGVRVVLGTQTMVPARASAVWDGFRLSGATDGDISGWIIATYVSGTLIDANGPAIALASHNDITGAIDNLLHNGALSVSSLMPIYSEHGRIAAAHGLSLLAYEGNLHLNLPPGTTEQRTQVRSFFKTLIDSPAAAAVTEANLHAFGAAGGDLACLYNLSSPSSDSGYFGIAGSGSWPAVQRHLARSNRTAH